MSHHSTKTKGSILQNTVTQTFWGKVKPMGREICLQTADSLWASKSTGVTNVHQLEKGFLCPACAVAEQSCSLLGHQARSQNFQAAPFIVCCFTHSSLKGPDGKPHVRVWEVLLFWMQSGSLPSAVCGDSSWDTRWPWGSSVLSQH